MLALARAYREASLQESGALEGFCSGCDYADRRDACPLKTRMQALDYDRCDWSMTSGVGAIPRTRETLAIWDPTQGEHVPHQRSNVIS